MKILAVDDDPFILELLPAMFEQADLNDLHTAPSGPAALDMIKAQKVPFDCMLLDVDMPEMDGIELCRRIRTVHGYEDKPILMLTAKTDSISIEKAFAAGANDYIAKPFNLKDIYNRIRVAERLLVSSKTIKRIDVSDLSKEGTQVAEDITLTDKVFLANVGRLILSFSLGNYITQLDRSELDNYQVFGVSIDDAERIFEQTSQQGFLHLLTSVAETLTDLITCPHLLMSYEGNGAFLCITRDPNLPEWDRMEAGLQAKLDALNLLSDDLKQESISLSVGTPIAPNANRTQRVKKTFERALSRAEMRYASKCAAA
ncbi:response regulator [Sulfitobacter pontiacus]|uniref:response regulator n=1 Tax=Sulfitobacter pontiacus TaxID=60137 RepID=UPI0015DE0973|nr:response regulator [Sulfitobacter pontiacus]QLL43212.1 response regulator [Sulfitobacter pontiacus]